MIVRPLLVRALVLAVVIGVLAAIVPGGPDLDRPPHVRPAAMGGGIVAAPVEAAGVGVPGDVIVFLEGVARAEWFAGVQAELDRAAAEAALVARARSSSSSSAPRSGAPVACAGVAWVVPVDVVIGESGCSFDAYNATGCNGFGCIGAYQFDARHWDASSGWGGCSDLDPSIPEDQHECARRLSSGGTNLAPWGR